MKYCEWEIEVYGWANYYNTECGQEKMFANGNIEDNNYKYCPYCGRPIKEIKSEVNQ